MFQNSFCAHQYGSDKHVKCAKKIALKILTPASMLKKLLKTTFMIRV